MTSWSCINRLGALLIALVLTVAPPVSTVHAVENTRKVSVVSFGLFGDQGVFRREAAGAAEVVAVSEAARSTCNTIRRKAAVRRSKAWPCHCETQPRESTPRTTCCF